MTPSEAKAVVREATRTCDPILMAGEPGIGKTSIIRQLCEEEGWRLQEISAALYESIDFRGAMKLNPEPDFVPIGEMREWFEDGPQMIVLLDDLGMAGLSTQKAAMRLLRERSIAGRKIADRVVFHAATNRKQDKAGQVPLMEPVKSRFRAIIHMTTDLEEVIGHGLDTGWAIEVLGFLRFRPELLSAFVPSTDLTNSPSPRGWESVSKAMGWNLGSSVHYEVFEGAVGERAAREFDAFLDMYRSLPSIDEVLMNPSAARVPDENPGAMWAVSQMVAHHAAEQNLPAVFEYIDRFQTREFAAKTVMDATRRDPQLCNTMSYLRWRKDNAEMFAA
jgi:hypothetical protein